MLNITKFLKKKEIINDSIHKGQSTRMGIKSIPTDKEWYNSVYSFNKNTIRFLPGVHNYVFKYLKSYFNTLNKNFQEKMTKKAKRIQRHSGEKIWISTPEIKHLADKLYITIYTYNRIYNLYKKKLSILEFDITPTIVLTKYKRINKSHNKPANKLFNKPVKAINITPKKKIAVRSNINTVGIVAKKVNISINKGFRRIVIKKNIHSNLSRYMNTNATKNKKFFVNDKYLINPITNKHLNITITSKPLFIEKRLHYTNYKNLIKWLKLDKLTIINQYKLSLLNSLTNKNWKSQLKFLKAQRHNYLSNQFKKELVYINLKQKMLFNRFKFNELYLAPMIEFLQTIYKKKVLINIVALKYYYLNTSILTQIIVTKLKNPKYRGKYIRVVNQATFRIKPPVLSSAKLPRVKDKFISMQNVILNDLEIKNAKLDDLEQFLLVEKVKSNRTVHKSVLRNIESKVISGIFVKISGRLTKRYKAQRALCSVRRKGTLKNVYSAHKGYSYKLSRGFSNINVEKTMQHSKTRVGAYGLTGWIASY